MKNIIAQSMEKLYQEFEKADSLFLESGMKDMDAYEKRLTEAARRAAAEHIAALYDQMDRMLCDDASRAEKYTIQRHDTRELLTLNGPMRFNHTLFRNREDGSCHYLLDEQMRSGSIPRIRRTADRCIISTEPTAPWRREKLRSTDKAITLMKRLAF